MRGFRTISSGVGIISTMMALPACTGLSGTTIVADYPEYSNVDELVASSSSIVLGVVGDSTFSALNGETVGDDPGVNPLAGTEQDKMGDTLEPLPITVFEITVIDCVKGGCVSLSSVKVKQLGGTVDGRTTSVEGIASLVPGETVLLFVEDYADSPSSILGGDAGLFVERDGRFVSLGNDLLTITSRELDGISK